MSARCRKVSCNSLQMTGKRKSLRRSSSPSRSSSTVAFSNCDAGGNHVLLISFVVLLGLFLMAVAVAISLAIHLRRMHSRRPVVVRKRAARSFSSSAGQTKRAKAISGGGGGCDFSGAISGDGAITDLEDCCQMTICDSVSLVSPLVCSPIVSALCVRIPLAFFNRAVWRISETKMSDK